jgi:transketolase
MINRLKHEIVKAAWTAKEGHIASAFSVIDIIYCLYANLNNFKFVLSKGHASLALYAVLADNGFFDISEMSRFCKLDCILSGHPDSTKIPGVLASTGSLGHGLPMAVGMAMGLKIQKSTQRVFVLIGDGESNEGTIWESCLVASHHNLDNLSVILDYNHSTDRAISLGNIDAKFIAFGMDTIIVNGHNQQEILDALQHKSMKPICIIANTIKGKGVSFMENNPAWHHKAPSDQEYAMITKELNEEL